MITSADPRTFQLRLSEAEKSRLTARIEVDFQQAQADHKRRMQRYVQMYRRWRNRAPLAPAGEEEASNFQVPLVKWMISLKCAKEADALFGDDAEIVAIPVGPSDERNVTKIGRYQTWRVFNDMKLTNPFLVFIFRKIAFGKSHAYSPWRTDYLDGAGSEKTYDGPGFYPLWPDDLVVPAQDVETIHDFPFCIRRYPVTPSDLLAGEEEGRYQGITENFEKILNYARQAQQRLQGPESDEVKLEKDEAEGVIYQGALSARECLQAHEWYGRWRMLREPEKDCDEYDLKGRYLEETDLVIRFIPGLKMIVGASDLADLYPDKPRKRRRPFVETSLIKDGSYWPPGFGEILGEMEAELTANHNLGTEAGEIAVGPVIFYRPATGFNPEKFRYEPHTAIPVDNPQTDIRVEHFTADLTFTQMKEQAILGYAERVTGLSDINMGRALDRPNAPRTASQYVTLVEEGNVRASLDTTVLREDMSAVLAHFWELDTMFAPEKLFFRVTEEQSQGLFPVRRGGAWLYKSDRAGRYDFRLKFATSVYSRQARKEQQLTLYQLDLANPLIAQNPKALYRITRQVHEALGDHNFYQLIPEPPDMDSTIPPKEEWVRVLQGEDIEVRPADDDKYHMLEHHRQMAMMQQDAQLDREAYNRLADHYVEHARQLRQKQQMQMMLAATVDSLGPMLEQVRGAGMLGPAQQAGQQQPGQAQPATMSGNGMGQQ